MEEIAITVTGANANLKITTTKDLLPAILSALLYEGYREFDVR